MRKFFAMGNLVADATIYTPQSGNRVAINFTLAVNERFKGNDGNQTEKSFFMSCSYWKPKDSVKIADYLKKGTHVLVEGLADVHTYTNKEGVAVPQQKIEVKEIKFTHSAKENNNVGKQQTNNTNNPNVDDSEDLPF